MTSSSVRHRKIIESPGTDQQTVLSEYDAAALRRKAQKKLGQQNRRLPELPSRDVQRLIADLYTRPVELETENEDLRRAPAETQTPRKNKAELA